ncbi:GNAT family acetyltransferase [Catellatospora sp. TT07R-123]|uniref:GNAT family N-acetyltransferase n=1 Tax=Catellatospora sp. TT07R-123 TaxID=2733863 RepID=UPI001B02206A|nr:GNAT family N-acetyltransferase [Catellatospora sp. TT07R-123]GHJ48390.1 GNAT family acetyltransferase [Catellatospora sp. TT07R-123]
MEIYLRTERLELRPFTGSAADVDDLYGLDLDPAVMEFLTGGRATAREEIRDRRLPELLAAYRRFPGFGWWAAVERASEAFLGWFALTRTEQTPAGEAELGYRLRREAWGRGYATEGSLALIGKGFGELGLERVTANTMTVNIRSRRVMEKCGLRYVRTYFLEWPDQIAGGEQGDVEYELLRSDWERARTPA